jgi:hypothetical protein
LEGKEREGKRKGKQVPRRKGEEEGKDRNGGDSLGQKLSVILLNIISEMN